MKELLKLYTENIKQLAKAKKKRRNATTSATLKRSRSGVFIVNFEHFIPFSRVSIVDFEQVNISWVRSNHQCLVNFFTHEVFLIGSDIPFLTSACLPKT